MNSMIPDHLFSSASPSQLEQLSSVAAKVADLQKNGINDPKQIGMIMSQELQLNPNSASPFQLYQMLQHIQKNAAPVQQPAQGSLLQQARDKLAQSEGPMTPMGLDVNRMAQIMQPPQPPMPPQGGPSMPPQGGPPGMPPTPQSGLAGLPAHNVGKNYDTGGIVAFDEGGNIQNELTADQYFDKLEAPNAPARMARGGKIKHYDGTDGSVVTGAPMNYDEIAARLENDPAITQERITPESARASVFATPHSTTWSENVPILLSAYSNPADLAAIYQSAMLNDKPRAARSALNALYGKGLPEKQLIGLTNSVDQMIQNRSLAQQQAAQAATVSRLRGLTPPAGAAAATAPGAAPGATAAPGPTGPAVPPLDMTKFAASPYAFGASANLGARGKVGDAPTKPDLDETLHPPTLKEFVHQMMEAKKAEGLDKNYEKVDALLDKQHELADKHLEWGLGGGKWGAIARDMIAKSSIRGGEAGYGGGGFGGFLSAAGAGVAGGIKEVADAKSDYMKSIFNETAERTKAAQGYATMNESMFRDGVMGYRDAIKDKIEAQKVLAQEYNADQRFRISQENEAARFGMQMRMMNPMYGLQNQAIGLYQFATNPANAKNPQLPQVLQAYKQYTGHDISEGPAGILSLTTQGYSAQERSLQATTARVDAALSIPMSPEYRAYDELVRVKKMDPLKARELVIQQAMTLGGGGAAPVNINDFLKKQGF